MFYKVIAVNEKVIDLIVTRPFKTPNKSSNYKINNKTHPVNKTTTKKFPCTFCSANTHPRMKCINFSNQRMTQTKIWL